MSEHCFRAYGIRALVVDNCGFSNPNNRHGKQAMKLMDGDGASITKCLFDGSTRFGRDPNDPVTNSLKNVNISGCDFAEWVRGDPGAKFSISDSKVDAHSSGNTFD